MSELVERYKALNARLVGLDADVESVKAEREGVCKQLLSTDGKGRVYDLGDGTPMVITTTKIGTHYMAPKNKWLKAGKLPKPPKVPRVPKAAKKAAASARDASKPLTQRKIVGGKIVEVPVPERRPSSIPPASSVAEAPKAEPVQSVAVATVVAEPVVQKQPEPVATVAKPSAPRDPLEAALAALDVSDLE